MIIIPLSCNACLKSKTAFDMDQDWLPDLYQPTNSHPKYEKGESNQTNLYRCWVQKCTCELRLVPYEPRLWLLRATCLLKLGYPELAASDAYKTVLLFDAAQHDRTSELGMNAALTVAMAYWLFYDPFQHCKYQNEETRFLTPCFSTRVEPLHCHWAETVAYILDKGASDARAALADALWTANCMADAVRTLQRAIRDRPRIINPMAHPNEEREECHKLTKMRNNLAEFQAISEKTVAQITPVRSLWPTSTTITGHILTRPCPWFQPGQGHSRRLPETVDALVKHMEPLSKGHATVRCSPLTSKCQASIKSTNDALGDALGVFATVNIQKNSLILVDYSILVSSSDPHACRSCGSPVKPNAGRGRNKIPICSSKCLAAGLLAFPELLNDHDDLVFPGIGPSSPWSMCRSSSAALLFRLLGIMQQTIITATEHGKQAPHPLSTAVMSGLTANYSSSKPSPFSLLDDIVYPIQMLRHVGIDVFAQHEWDMWVLTTIKARISNNQWGAQFGGRSFQQGLHSLYSLFNHGCKPNVRVDYDSVQRGGPKALRFVALRDIVEGEELCHAYLDVRDLTLLDRAIALRPWMEVCLCALCVEERGLEGGLATRD